MRNPRPSTVNQWVVGDSWLDAEATIVLLHRFDVQLAKPSYLVNRWLTAVVRLYENEIAQLIRERYHTLAASPYGRLISLPIWEIALEVTSSLIVDLKRRAHDLAGVV